MAHRTHGKISLTRSPVYHKIITQERPYGRDAQDEAWGKGVELPWPL